MLEIYLKIHHLGRNPLLLLLSAIRSISAHHFHSLDLPPPRSLSLSLSQCFSPTWTLSLSGSRSLSLLASITLSQYVCEERGRRWDVREGEGEKRKGKKRKEKGGGEIVWSTREGRRVMGRKKISGTLVPL